MESSYRVRKKREPKEIPGLISMTKIQNSWDRVVKAEHYMRRALLDHNDLMNSFKELPPTKPSDFAGF